MTNVQLPYGFQDYMPDECYNKILLENKLSEVFSLHGFDRVETPTIEYYDIYNGVLDSASIKKIFKMTDVDGNLIVLRPDTTLQIARMAATKLDLNFVNKLFYVANSFEYLTSSSSARTREFAQVGVEMLGSSGIEGDIECITLSIEALKKVQLDDFLLEIGNVEFFNGLMEQAGLEALAAKELRRLVNNKDMLGVEMFLRSKDVKSDFIDAFLLLPTLFGDISVLDKAEALCKNETGKAALNNMRKIMKRLEALGLDKYVSIDLGMLRGNYYTGIIMRGVVKNLGVSILDGGRYDTLGDSFGQSMQAVGFAIGMKRLLIALDNQNKLKASAPCDYAFISDSEDEKFEYEILTGLRQKGKRVTKLFNKDKIQLVEYAKQKCIKNAFMLIKGKRIDIEIK